jgi:putative ABC transport system permease protein
MQKILGRRLLRDFKSNFFRYAALGLMIILGMYIVISVVGAADTIIGGVNSMAEKNHLEDGEFSVFVPLTGTQQAELDKKGITLEKKFYLDYQLKDTSVIRVYKNRKQLNLLALDDGREAEKINEAVLEKRYCEEHGLSLGDSIEIDGSTLKIVGIGSVQDYDAMLRNMSDTSVDSKYFGLAFVMDKQYEKLKASGNYKNSEEYSYAYKRNGKLTDSELKDYLYSMDFNAEEVTDPYFKEFWNKTGGKKNSITTGIKQLADGSDGLKRALEKMKSSNADINKGSDRIFMAYLEEASGKLSEFGYRGRLTRDNYKTVLSEYIGSVGDDVLRTKLKILLEELTGVETYIGGIESYTGGVAKSSEAASELSNGVNELKNNTNELLDKYFKINIKNLTQFVIAGDNPRIKASSEDLEINKLSGLLAGIIVMILFTYVISVFVVHSIERESSVIGTLYALGVRKTELIMHYLALPVAITLIAGICGTVIGFSRYGAAVQMRDSYTYFSIPEFKVLFPAYLIIYGIVMPPLTAALVNYFVIGRKLSQPALKMIRNERKSNEIYNIKLGNMSFTARFRIRQLLREARTGITVVLGMFISLLVMMLGIDCYALCNNISVDNKADTKYEYMYVLKYPQEQVPTEGEACYTENLSKEAYGLKLDVTLLGIDEKNPYFNVKTFKGKNKAVVSTSAAQKFNLKKGDRLVLEDRANNSDYAFTVEDIVPYSVGLYVFMDIGSMRELFGQEESYYNTVLSSRKLNIESGRLYAVSTKKDIIKSSEVFINKMRSMIISMIVVSAIIFCVVMYLMMKVMIDRASFSISLVKIFGYRTAEIRKLYLNGNFYIVSIGALICIPFSKMLMDSMYPYLVSNVACGINLTFSWQLYIGIFGGILLLYFIINHLLVSRLKNIVPAEILKNRE